MAKAWKVTNGERGRAEETDMRGDEDGLPYNFALMAVLHFDTTALHCTNSQHTKVPAQRGKESFETEEGLVTPTLCSFQLYR